MMQLRDMRVSFLRDHVWTRRHLHAYLDGELEPAAQARVQRHAQLCPPCHRLVATLTATLAGLRGLREPWPPDEVVDGVIARLRGAG